MTLMSAGKTYYSLGMPHQKTTIMLVDDHSVVRAGYRRLLEMQPEFQVVAEAGDGPEACRQYHKHHPDLVIMDLSLPGMGGMEAARRMLSHHPHVRILIFTIHDSSVFAERALRMGVSGYITKSSDPDVLLEAVAQVAAGETYLGPDIAKELALRQISKNNSPLSQLSAKEFGIFLMMAAGNKRATIAETLHISVKTVSNYAHQIKKKLGLSTDAEVVHLAIRHGLIKT